MYNFAANGAENMGEMHLTRLNQLQNPLSEYPQIAIVNRAWNYPKYWNFAKLCKGYVPAGRLHFTSIYYNHRRSARCNKSVKTLPTVAQPHKNPIWKKFATGEWPWRSLKIIRISTVRQAIYHFQLVVFSNNISVFHHFWDISISTVYISLCYCMPLFAWSYV